MDDDEILDLMEIKTEYKNKVEAMYKEIDEILTDFLTNMTTKIM